MGNWHYSKDFESEEIVMGGGKTELSGPDFSRGFKLRDLKDGSMLLGQVQGEAVLLVRRGDRAHAVSAFCTHYGAPLSDGVVTGDGIRCPWHHACFSLESGAPLSPPALNGLTVWEVRHEGEQVFVTGKKVGQTAAIYAGDSKAMVVVGGGAAGQVAVETLRNEGYGGRIVMVSEDSSLPYDRPNLSKDFLAGNAPEEWIPLRSASFFEERGIEVRLNTTVRKLDHRSQSIELNSGEAISYQALLIATGSRPLKLPVPGVELPHVHTLRSLSDSRKLIESASRAKNAVIIGAGFIGLEVAAALRTRGLTVTVVGKESIPFEKSLGPEIGECVRRTHERNGVRFQLGKAPRRINASEIEISDGSRLPAELVVLGAGVAPATEIAEDAGIETENGILVNRYLETSLNGVFSAGDVARYPEPITGETARIEHWVLAQRQARIAALNMLGKKIPFTGVPFFWSHHFDLTIGFTGYAPKDAVRQLFGSIEGRDCLVAYRHRGKVTAVATIGRDRQALLVEEALERNDFSAIERIIRHP